MPIRRLLSVILIWGFWVSFIIVILRSNNAPDYHLSYGTRKIVSSILPQGWGFFTRDPKEGITEAYSYNKHHLKLITVRNASAENLVGFSRNARFAGIDLAQLLNQSTKDIWHSGKGNFRDFIPPESDTLYLEEPNNTFPTGEYVLYRYEPIPFAWASQHQEGFRPFAVAHIMVVNKISICL